MLKKVSLIKRVITLMLFLMLSLMCFGRVAFASRSDVDSITYIAENQPEVATICSKANKVTDGVTVLVYTADDGMLSFSNKNYASLDMDTRREFMETALLTTKESGLGSQIRGKVYNFIADQDNTTSAAVKYLRSDASADFVAAASLFKPFGSLFGIILGVVSLFIFMFMGFSILADVAYMVLPGFRVFSDGKTGNDRPKWVSREAYSAVKESEESINRSNYKSYMALYAQRRFTTLTIMAIALGYLISGQIYDFIVFLIDAFSWMFQW